MKDLFTWEKPNALTPEFCTHVIEKFEQDDRKTEGCVGGPGSVDRNIKRSTDLYLFSAIPEISEDWKDEIETFHNSLNQGLQDYFEHLHHTTEGVCSMSAFMRESTYDSGYQIQRTKPSEGYIWHEDSYNDSVLGVRVLTYIWYLNDVAEGGHTEFYSGDSVQPETGKLLIFPATWTYYHRGCPPVSNTKYIVTGWLFHDKCPYNREKALE